MKNRVARLALILLAVAATCLSIGALILLTDNGEGNRFAEEHTVNDELLFSSGDVKSLRVESITNTIRVHETDTDTIRFHLNGSHAGPDENLLWLDSFSDNGELVVRVRRKHIVMFLFYYENVTLDIYLPKMTFERLNIDTTSADLDAQFLRASEFSYDTTSGDMHIGTLETGQTTINTTSGDVLINAMNGRLLFNSVSGEINARFEKLADDISISTTAGATRITLPANSEFRLDTSSVSGSVYCDFPLLRKECVRSDHEWSAVVGAGKIKITWGSVSGDLELLAR